VARERAACPRPGGGVGIQTPRPSRARVATSTGALGLCALLAAYPLVDAGPSRELLAIPGAFAFGLLAACLVAGWPGSVGTALVLLAAQYAAALAVAAEATVDAAAPLYAAGLLLLAELSYWSLDVRGPGHEETRVVVRRLTTLAVLGVLALVLGAFVVVLTSAPLGGGVLWDSVGVAAAVGILLLVTRLARRELQP
jgi:hypothetical protein